MRLPTTADSATDNVGRKTCLGGPIHDGQGASVHLQAKGPPLVSPLFSHGSPPAVGGGVVPVRVFSVDGVPRRAWSHVLVERLEGPPTGVYFDPPASVVRPRHVVRVGTPGEHRTPRLVLGGARKSMRRVAFLATARALPSRSEVSQQHLHCAPTRAPNLNEPVLIPLLGKVTKHHKVTERISWGHYNTIFLAAATGFRATGSKATQLPYTHFPADAPDLGTSRSTSGGGIPNHRPETVNIGCRTAHAPEITIVGCWGQHD